MGRARGARRGSERKKKPRRKGRGADGECRDLQCKSVLNSFAAVARRIVKHRDGRISLSRVCIACPFFLFSSCFYSFDTVDSINKTSIGLFRGRTNRCLRHFSPLSEGGGGGLRICPPVRPSNSEMRLKRINSTAGSDRGNNCT